MKHVTVFSLEWGYLMHDAACKRVLSFRSPELSLALSRLTAVLGMDVPSRRNLEVFCVSNSLVVCQELHNCFSWLCKCSVIDFDWICNWMVSLPSKRVSNVGFKRRQGLENGWTSGLNTPSMSKKRWTCAKLFADKSSWRTVVCVWCWPKLFHGSGNNVQENIGSTWFWVGTKNSPGEVGLVL